MFFNVMFYNFYTFHLQDVLDMKLTHSVIAFD